MPVTTPRLAPLEFGEPARSNGLELASRMLDLVEIRHELIIGQRGVVNDQQPVESRPQFAH